MNRCGSFGLICIASLSAAIALFSARIEAQATSCTTYQAARTEWQTDMGSYGQQWGNFIAPSSSANFDQKLDAVYYDGQWVFQQIGRHLGQTTPWTTYAEYARQIYVEQYARPAGFSVQGFRRFPHGMYFGGGPSLAQDLALLRDIGPFSRLSEYRNEYTGTNAGVSRELAYAIQANIYAEKAGQARVIENGTARLPQMVRWTASHFRSWKTGTYAGNEYAPRFAPFMAALSGHALIEWIEWETANGRDPNANWDTTTWPTIQAMLVDFYLWSRNTALVRTGSFAGQRMWTTVNGRSTYRYEDNGDSSAAWDLGNLIAYPYAWTAKWLKDNQPSRLSDAQLLMQTADDLFIGTVNNGWLGGGKQFNQAYRLSFLYVALKDVSGLGYCGSAAPNPPSSVIVE